MSSLTPMEWDAVIDKFLEDDKLFQLYHRSYVPHLLCIHFRLWHLLLNTSRYISKSYSSDECTGPCRCSKLRDLVYNRHIACSSSDEDLRQYRQMNQFLCWFRSVFHFLFVLVTNLLDYNTGYSHTHCSFLLSCVTITEYCSSICHSIQSAISWAETAKYFPNCPATI